MTVCRTKLARIIHSKLFSNTIIALIIVNSITLGLETNADMMASYKPFLHTADHIILGIFVAELLMRLYVFRANFFKSGWNVFDFLIIGISILPHVGPFSMLRTFRILRTFRLLSTVPAMRKVVTALIQSIPGMLSVLSILFIVFYVAAVIATQQLGNIPDPKMQELFGTLGHSLFTLFQLMTMDNFTDDIIQPTLKYYPDATPYFVAFIVVTTFSVLNLFIGIIVDALNGIHDQTIEAEHERLHEEEMQALRELRAEVARMVEQTKVR